MDALLAILNKEAEAYSIEYELAKQRVSAIANDNIKKLEEIVKSEEKILDEIMALEEKREAEMKNRGYSVLVDYINSLNDEKFKQDLTNVRKKLRELLAGIKEENETCEELVQISEGILNGVIKSVTGKREFGYKKDSMKREVSQTNLLNKKI